jgi:hypothetical protein
VGAGTVLVHEPTLEAEGAARVLRGEEVRGLSFQRLLGRLRPDRLRGLDLVFVPHWYCSFRVVLESGRSQHVAEAVWTMVDALAGTVLRLPGEPPLVPRDLAALAPAVALAPSIDREQAVARARDGLRWDLRLRSRQRIAPRELELVAARLAHVPFWVGYYAGPGDQLRARAVHGVEATLQDGAFTQVLLRALEAGG